MTHWTATLSTGSSQFSQSDHLLPPIYFLLIFFAPLVLVSSSLPSKKEFPFPLVNFLVDASLRHLPPCRRFLLSSFQWRFYPLSLQAPPFRSHSLTRYFLVLLDPCMKTGVVISFFPLPGSPSPFFRNSYFFETVSTRPRLPRISELLSHDRFEAQQSFEFMPLFFRFFPLALGKGIFFFKKRRSVNLL